MCDGYGSYMLLEIKLIVKGKEIRPLFCNLITWSNYKINNVSLSSFYLLSFFSHLKEKCITLIIAFFVIKLCLFQLYLGLTTQILSLHWTGCIIMTTPLHLFDGKSMGWWFAKTLKSFTYVNFTIVSFRYTVSRIICFRFTSFHSSQQMIHLVGIILH